MAHLADGLSAQELHGLIIHDHTIISHNAVVAITVVGIQCHIGVHLGRCMEGASLLLVRCFDHVEGDMLQRRALHV